MAASKKSPNRAVVMEENRPQSIVISESAPRRGSSHKKPIRSPPPPPTSKPAKSPIKSSLKVAKARQNDSGRSRSSKSGEDSTQKSSRSGSLSLGGRLSSLIGRKSLTPGRGKRQDAADEDIEAEHDPVIDLLEARTTQRVRFSVDTLDSSRAELPNGAKNDEKTSGKEPGRSDTSQTDENHASFSIKSFMKRNLFGKTDASSPSDTLYLSSQLVWESAGDSAEFVQSCNSSDGSSSDFALTFVENPDKKAEIVKLLNKGRLAQYSYFKYEYAVKCFVKALKKLNDAKYPDEHPLMLKTLRALNNAHHAVSSFKNSANIVKMGIRSEETGDYIKALKMYTIAYRIRRDNLSRSHPSLPVLLNILASIQTKRGELKEALQIYELALKDVPVFGTTTTEEELEREPTGNLLVRAVTFREMGALHEKLGDESMAATMYHKSLDCASRWRDAHDVTRREETPSPISTSVDDESSALPLLDGQDTPSPNTALCSLQNVQFARSFQSHDENDGCETGEMELFISSPNDDVGRAGDDTVSEFYESFFPSHPTEANSSHKKGGREEVERANLEIALTLHQIGQMYRRQTQYDRALDAFRAALRGMRYSFGEYHPNVAAVLGNIGNLQKEMGLLDDSYDTYQEVLSIESRRLGVSHPEVAISLHNVATIEAARGNYTEALSIYKKVLNLQKKLFGEQHVSVAVTSTCMGDVHEKLGELRTAMRFYEEALKIMTATLGRHHIEVARMLHKMGRTSYRQEEYHLADSFVTRALLLYRLNKVNEDHKWIVDVHRLAADIDASIALGGGLTFEC